MELHFLQRVKLALTSGIFSAGPFGRPGPWEVAAVFVGFLAAVVFGRPRFFGFGFDAVEVAPFPWGSAAVFWSVAVVLLMLVVLAFVSFAPGGGSFSVFGSVY